MVEPEFDPKNGVWRCPLCGWTAMSRKVVENHIQRSHPEAFQNEQKVTEKPSLNEQKHQKREMVNSNNDNSGNSKKKKKGGKWKKFKIGNTYVRVLDRAEVEVREQRGWSYFMTANYVASLHRQRVRLKLASGEELEGQLKAKDPYFVALEMEGDRKLYINKNYIVWIEPIRVDEDG